MLEVVYYKQVVIINHTRCNTLHLESLIDIGNVGNVEINDGIFENQDQYIHMWKFDS